MRILLNGMCGHMGAEVVKLAEAGYRGAELVAGADPNAAAGCAYPCVTDIANAETNVDCIVDFSHHACTNALLEFAVKNNLPLVLATTGQTPEERDAITAAATKIPLFFAANYSLGIALLIELAKIDLGIACVIKDFVKDELDDHSLTEVSLGRAIPKRKLGLVYKDDTIMTNAMKKFISYFTEA